MAKVNIRTARSVSAADHDVTVAGSDHQPGLNDPAAVLTCAFSGMSRLRELLESHSNIACISGAGVPYLCKRITDSWMQVDSGPAGSPALAGIAIRRMIATMLTPYLAYRGKKRWCDTSIGSAEFAEIFLQVFPFAKFICLYRNCTNVIKAFLGAFPGDLSGHGIDPYLVKHPGNNTAAVARYWVVTTEATLTFEEAHPEHCHRVRYEDLTAQTAGVLDGVCSFLLADPGPGSPGVSSIGDQLRAGPAAAAPEGEAEDGHAWTAPIQEDSIPPMLRARINDLLGRLDYPTLNSIA
jgi:protein-tyrosine sulfotransferase